MLLVFTEEEKHFKATPTQKRYYTTRDVSYLYLIGTDEQQNFTRECIELINGSYGGRLVSTLL